MNQVIRIIFPFTDLAQDKAICHKLSGVEPYVKSPYYVGFRVAGQEIGLDPNRHKAGMTGYSPVDNIKQNLQSLLVAGAQIQQEIKDIGGAGLVASVKDADGSIIGLLQ